MAQILLLHSAYGLRPAVTAAADRLRAAGHTVHVPDLYDGEVFEDIEAGLAYHEQVGTDELLRRAIGAAAPLLTPGPGWSTRASRSAARSPRTWHWPTSTRWACCSCTAPRTCGTRPWRRSRCSCTWPSPTRSRPRTG